jgi:hypothetical protein
VPDWEEVRAHLRQVFRVAKDRPGWMGLFAEPDKDGGQPIRVETVTLFDEPWLLLLADAGRASTVSPVDALRWNMSLGLGALALERERLVVRACLPLAGLTPAALDRAVRFVAAEGARLRAMSPADPEELATATTHLFTGYTE